MSDRTKIAWSDATWNPFRGCTRVSPGCQHCYAERMCSRDLPNLMSPTTGDKFSNRTPSGPRWTGKVELIESALDIPWGWRKPRRIFVNSMSDTFHEEMRDTDIETVLAVCWCVDRHTYIIPTKRIQRAKELLPRIYAKWSKQDLDAETAADWAGRRHDPAPPLPPPNVILLASVEDQQRADERIPGLLATPAAVRGISLEPMLGPVDLRWYLTPGPTRNGRGGYSGREVGTDPLDWVIVGGESGPGARPCNVEWIRDVVRQCREAGVACFVKQITERGKQVPFEQWPEDIQIREFPYAS